MASSRTHQLTEQTLVAACLAFRPWDRPAGGGIRCCALTTTDITLQQAAPH